MPAAKAQQPLSWSERRDIATIARAYYVKDETIQRTKKQSEIAQESRLTQTEVSRRLALAREHGVVRFEINQEWTKALRNALRERFTHLQDVRIVPLVDKPGSKKGDPTFLQALGREGARYLLETVRHGTKLGVSCGHSVAAVAAALAQLRAAGEALPIACKVFPLVTLMEPARVRGTPAGLVAHLVEALPQATGQVLQLPPAESDADLAFYDKCQMLCQLEKDITDLDYYVIGIGMIDTLSTLSSFRAMERRSTYEFTSLINALELMPALQDRGAMGEALYQTFDRTGAIIPQEGALTQLRSHVRWLPLRVLQEHVRAKKKPVIAVAAGSLKHDAILAALKAGICNVLITDSGAAAAILHAIGALPSPPGDAPHMPADTARSPLSWWSERSHMATIARRHYYDRETQRDIAQDLGRSQTEVARDLERAKAYGIIDIKIDEQSPEPLRTALLERFTHLQDVRIVPLVDMPGNKSGDAPFLQALGREGARYLLETVRHGTKLGVGCGHSVAAVATALGDLRAEGESLPSACRVFSLVTLMEPTLLRGTPAGLMAHLVEALPQATGQVLQLPRAENDADLKFYTSHKSISQLQQDITDLDYYVIGIGMIDTLSTLTGTGFRDIDHRPTYEFTLLLKGLELIPALQDRGAMGEALYQPFDCTGAIIPQEGALTQLRYRVLALPLQVLQEHVRAKKKPVIAVAAGSLKHDAILAALKAGICNVLITDSGAAAAILSKVKAESQA